MGQALGVSKACRYFGTRDLGSREKRFHRRSNGEEPDEEHGDFEGSVTSSWAETLSSSLGRSVVPAVIVEAGTGGRKEIGMAGAHTGARSRKERAKGLETGGGAEPIAIRRAA